LAAGLAGAALVWNSNSYKVACENRLLQARSDLSVARDSYRRAIDADDILKTSQQRYRLLRDRGFIGDEPRLLWIEALRNIGQQRHLYNLQYNLQQRQELPIADGESTEHYRVYESVMHLDLDLAHEVDLLRYFSALDRDPPGVYQLRDCTLSTLFGSNEVSLDKANISASCNLAWFTVKTADDAGTTGDSP
jgi:hypothetical protein